MEIEQSAISDCDHRLDTRFDGNRSIGFLDIDRSLRAIDRLEPQSNHSCWARRPDDEPTMRSATPAIESPRRRSRRARASSERTRASLASTSASSGDRTNEAMKTPAVPMKTTRMRTRTQMGNRTRFVERGWRDDRSSPWSVCTSVDTVRTPGRPAVAQESRYAMLGWLRSLASQSRISIDGIEWRPVASGRRAGPWRSGPAQTSGQRATWRRTLRRRRLRKA